MYSKILICGEIEIVTGLHIGTGGDYAAIGAADSPVIRDSVSGMPMIPGSSLKGKLRSLLVKKYNTQFATKPDEDAAEIVSLFGGKSKPSRLIFSDMLMCNMQELKTAGIYNPTEIKFENTIKRISAIATPRQIERVIRGSRFDMQIIYNVSADVDVAADIALIADAMKMLKYDYLGGHGSRGYGKIKFVGLNAEAVAGNDDGELDELIDKCNRLLEEVSADEI